MVNLDKFLNVDGIVVRRQLLIDNEVRLFKFPIVPWVLYFFFTTALISSLVVVFPLLPVIARTGHESFFL